MFCKNCGSKLEENSLFCGNCGIKVEKQTEENNTKKNNMKNALIILSICALIVALAVVVYLKFFNNTAKSNADKIESALNNMNDIKNGTFKLGLDMKATTEEETIEVGLDATSDIDTENKLASLNMKVNVMGISTEIPAYLDFNNENAVLYFNVPAALVNSGTYPLEAGYNKIMLGNIFSNIKSNEEPTKIYIEEYLKTNEIIEKVDSKDKNIDNYIIHFNKEALKKLSEDDANDFDMSQLEGTGLENGFDLNLSINKKENYVTKISIDFKNISVENISFEKFLISFEITNINKIKEIKIPNEAQNAKELDLNNFGIPEIGTTEPEIVNPQPEVGTTKKDEPILEQYGYTINFNLNEGYEPSSVNSETFKIYRKDGMRVIMSIDYNDKNEFFQGVEEEKQNNIENDSTNVRLSEIKELTHKDKKFYYQILEYTTKYNTNEYEVYLCYELDNEHVYTVTYEDEDHIGSVNEDKMRDFLDITITK